MGIIQELFKQQKNTEQVQNNNLQTSYRPENQSYIRQTLNVPQYDSRTLGIDIQADIEKFKNIFRGRRLDPEGKKYINFEGAQEILNEAGSEWLLSNHESMLSISNATTNIENNNQVLELCEEYADNLLEILLSMEKEWEINPAFFDMIIDTLVRNYQLFLLKSYKNEQRRLMAGQPQQQPENVMPQARFTM